MISYSFTDPDGNSWILNVTTENHTLFPGYVLRGAVNGKVVSYGEGAAWKQSLGKASDLLINNVWNGQNQANINAAK